MFKKSLLIMLFVALMAPWAANAQQTLPVNDGTVYVDYAPFNGYYHDQYTKVEWITPASSLTDMEGASITSMKFYVQSIATGNYTWTSTFKVFMKEVPYSTIPSSPYYTGTEGATVVYENTISLPSATGEFEISFTTPYNYEGGNLLIGIYNITKGGYRRVYFYGNTESDEYVSVTGQSSSSLDAVSGTRKYFLPKTTFVYTPGSSDCPKPKNPTIADITSDGATFGWTAGTNYTGTYDVAVSTNNADEPQNDEIVATDVNSTSYGFEDLTPGTTYYAYVRAHCGSDWAKINFTTDFACSAPTNLGHDALTSNSATLSWTAGGTETSWNLRYKTASSDWIVIPNITKTNNVYVLTSLTTHTGYTWQVQANCPGEGNGTSDWSAEDSFTTECGAVSITPNAYQYGFEDAAELDCWTMTNCYFNSSSINTGLYSNYPRTGSNSFRFYYSSTTNPQTLITPQLSTTSKGVRVEFYYRTQYSGSSYEQKFKVGYSTTDTDVSNFTWDDEITTTSNAYTLYQHDFAVNGIKYIAIQYIYDKNYSLYIDDVTLSEAPSCIEPSALAASGITSSTATLSWTAGSGSQDHWDIYYSTSATAPTASSTPTVSNTGTNPYTIESLTENTTYYAWVRGNCGNNDYSEWSEGISFTTACNAFAIPHDYGFEDAAELDCWTIRNGHSTTGITSGTTSSGSYKFQFAYGSGYGTQYLITPELSGTSNGLHVQFYYCRQYSTNTINVGHSTTTNETTAFTWNETSIPTQSYSLFEYDFPANTKYIAIKFNGSGYDNVYIDDISFSVPNNCAKPTGLTAVANTLSSNGITLTWTAGGEESEWTLQYATNNTFTTGLVTIEDINTNQKAITGLTANTTYYARVKANCSATSESEWCNDIYDFTTSCGAYDIPHSYGFEAAAEMDCWTVIKGSSSSTGRVSGDGHNSSSYCFEFYYTSTAQYLISPEWSNATNGVHVEFYYKRYNSYANSFRVGYTTVANTTNDADFTWTDAITNSASTSEYQKFEDDFVANNIKHIAIKYETTSYSGLYVDDIAVSVLPSCIKPKNLAVVDNSVTSHAATLSWTAGYEETAWTLQYSTNADFSGTPSEVEVVDTPTKEITGLTGSTTYYVRVKAECGDNDDSDWSAVVSFTTDVACVTPTDFTATSIGSHSASLYWTADEGQDTWEVEYATNSSYTESTLVENITGSHSAENPYMLTGLPTPGTLYYVRVRSNCGGEGVSAWSGNKYISTKAAATAPSSIAISDITTNSADFTWTGASTNDYHVDYEFCFSTTNSVPELVEDENYFKGIENESYKLEGLTYNTTYYAWVRDNCGTDGYSSWTASGSFTTLELCPTPSNLHMTAYTATTATLAWNAVTGQDAWLLYYSTSDVAPDDETTSGDNIIAISTTASYTIEGLTAETTYYAWVRGNCTASDYGYSSWSSVCEFMPSAAMTLDLYTTGTATNNDRIPFYANNTDSYAGIESQFIIPATDMGGDIPGGTIQKLTFYSSYGYDASFGAATFEVKISEVDETYFNSNTLYTITSDAVYSGGFSYSNGKLTITLATPYVYKGGNLLVDIKLTKKGSAAYINWDGVTSTNNQSIYKPYSGTNTRYKFSPKTTITYIPATAFTTAGNWNVAGNWSTGEIPVSTDNVILKAAATIPANYTAQADVVALGTGGSLVIADGGQLICNNAVAATVQKTIDNWNTTSWYFIASPMASADGIDPNSVTGMITDTYAGDDDNERTYDLYRLNNPTWENYRNSNYSDFTLVNGMGYLYASKNGTTLAFSGNIQPSNENKTVSGLNDGYNLVGNPFTCEAYVNQSYYTLSQAEARITSATVGTPKETSIAPLTGVVISGTSVTFSKEAPVTSTNNGNVQMVLSQIVATRGGSNAETLDNAIVSFNEGAELGKFYFGNQNANIYIPMEDKEYAIVSTEAQGEMPVCFKANADGEYTITVNTDNVEMGYLHLIDNKTGADIDLLSNPSYTFNATTTDYASRFRLVFKANDVNDITVEGNEFAFIGNGQLIIANEGEAILQVIDITGRVLSTEVINGDYSKALNATTGVYVLRLINGETTKTQKIVVK